MDWNRISEDYLAVTELVFGPLRQTIEDVAGEVVARLKAGNKVLFCGNGGSAADAQHLAAEFVNRFLKERKPYAGLALSTDTSILTSIGNDYSFDEVFSKQVQALGRKGDVLVAISTSGMAANVCRAVEAAKGLGILTVAMTGGTGGKLAGLVDRVISISCTTSTPRIQEGHL
ncbi:MAG TPA: SIS domain-containing protein, partial [Kiritimatiellia bacterium]